MLGSATICLVALHPSKPELIAANIGDSGFLLLRPAHTASPRLGTLGVAAQGAAPSSPEADGQARYSVAFRSPQQLRSFNAPFQLGLAPDSPEEGGAAAAAAAPASPAAAAALTSAASCRRRRPVRDAAGRGSGAGSDRGGRRRRARNGRPLR